MPELDTLRGLAIAGVVCLHGFYWQHGGMLAGSWGRLILDLSRPGWLGVNLFFVLSGFLITGILLDSAARPDRYRRFYARRALRILPAYCAVLIVLWLFGQASRAYLALGLAFLANVTSLFGVAQYYGPFWTLAVEEQFYLFWPAAVWRLSRRGVAWLASAVVVLTPLARGVAFHYGQTDGLAEYTWFVLDGLACGALLAVLLRSGISRRGVWRIALTLVAIAVVAGLAGWPVGIATRTRLAGAAFQYTLISLFFSGMLLLTLLCGTSRWTWLTTNRPLRFLGFISYGLYLIHVLAFWLYDQLCRQLAPQMLPRDDHFGLVVLRFGIAGAAAVLLAWLSRVHFEERFLRMRDRVSGPAAAAVFSPS